jgi:hypothetical protein
MPSYYLVIIQKDTKDVEDVIARNYIGPRGNTTYIWARRKTTTYSSCDPVVFIITI